MWQINMIVVEEIMTSWEDVAYALEYGIEQVEAIKSRCRENPKICCKNFFVDWLSTSHGIGPKTWKMLLNILKTRVGELTAGVEKIEYQLLKVNITPEE